MVNILELDYVNFAIRTFNVGLTVFGKVNIEILPINDYAISYFYKFRSSIQHTTLLIIQKTPQTRHLGLLYPLKFRFKFSIFLSSCVQFLILYFSGL